MLICTSVYVYVYIHMYVSLVWERDNGVMEAVLPYWTKGEVVRGFGRGSKQLGIPTG